MRTGDRPSRFDSLIEHYRLEKERRLKRRAMSQWRKVEAEHVFAALEKPPERIH